MPVGCSLRSLAMLISFIDQRLRAAKLPFFRLCTEGVQGRNLGNI
jgi:hypothetical protein